MSRRRMSSNEQGQFGGHRVYVGDIGRINRTQLESEFSQYGPVIDVWMGSRRDMVAANFAFIVYRYPEDAEEAVRDRNGRKVCGRVMRVEHAKPVGSRVQRGSGGFDRHSRGAPPPRRRSRSRERYDRYEQRSPSPMRNQRAPPSPDRHRNPRRRDSPQKKRVQSFSRSRSPQPKKHNNTNRREVSTSRSPPPRRQTKKSNVLSPTLVKVERSLSRSAGSSRSVSPAHKKKKQHGRHSKQRAHSPSASPPHNRGDNGGEYDARQYQHKHARHT